MNLFDGVEQELHFLREVFKGQPTEVLLFIFIFK